jgi:hypothetical protein
MPTTYPEPTQTPTPVTATAVTEAASKLTKLINEKKAAREYQERRHAAWNEIYELYRNKPRVNRLTQRQAVNVPLMKETIKTSIAKTDDAPFVDWKEKSGDEMKELIYQEMWDKGFRDTALELVDIMDKKNVFLYGVSTKFLNVGDKGVTISVLDNFDVLYDPQMNPLDVESARFIVRQNIFRRLRDVLVDERYTQSSRDKLKDYYASEKGIIQSGANRIQLEKKIARLKAMGMTNNEFAYFEGGDTIVNLTEHFSEIWDTTKKEFVRRVIIQADDREELCDDTLVECHGTNFWPFEPWYEDGETNDVYPDGIGDLILTPNKILNVWFSQMAENRTLKNFQMHWYDATIDGYQPQTYEPAQGRMLPAPGNPNDTIKPVEISGLDDTFDSMNYVIAMVERATGVTALEKGTPEGGDQTLGEIQILVGKATERAKTVSKFYRISWYRTAVKWNAIMQANHFGEFTLYKTGGDGKMYEKKVTDKDWKSDAGYEPTVASSSEQEAEQIKSLQKWGLVMKQFPGNKVLTRIAQQRNLKLLDLTPAELKEVEEEQKQMALAPQPLPMPEQTADPQPDPLIQAPAV